ncbi:MAG TPA: hypothetical protein PL110_12045 [Candidatus Eremiobacteraeota bacterium]|nr:MAG: hypothetical protein BWY64_00796 [bacterium ADurb.Bin363]HPZ08841.1 hypothetical protein [Candidatus Eremiobacteraeota bacterium]
MIKSLSNHSFTGKTGKSSLKKERDVNSIISDSVVFSSDINPEISKEALKNSFEENTKEKEIKSSLEPFKFSSIEGDINSLIKEKQKELKGLKEHLSSLEKNHELLHIWQTVETFGEELYSNHQEILKLRKKIEKVEREIRFLKLEKYTKNMTYLPEDVAKYYLNVNMDINSSELKKIGEHYTLLAETPYSPMSSEGNRVKTLENSEIWKEMNDLLDVKEKVPTEIDLSFHLIDNPAMYKKIGDAARGGHKIRILIDPGAGFTGEGYYADGSELYQCLKTLEELRKETKGTDIGIVLMKKEDIKNSMKRNLLRVGDKVITGAMDTDKFSGENVDYAMLIEGPGAKSLSERFIKDVNLSSGKTMEEIIGKDNSDLLNKGFVIDKKTGDEERRKIILKSKDFRHFLTSLLPEESQKHIESAKNTADCAERILEEYKKHGMSVDDFGTFHTSGNICLTDEKFLACLMNDSKDGLLSDEGRIKFSEKFNKYFTELNSEENMSRLKDITLPEGKEAGSQELAVANSHEELQALMVYAINSAEDFLYIPSFCLTEDMAKLLIEKKKSMDKKCKEMDIKVILEPSLINMEACLILEEAGIPVRWAILDGTGSGNDRKLASGMMVSDKIFLTGPDMSNEGLRKDIHTSVMAFFEPDIDETVEKRDEYRKSFLRLWEKETLDFFNTFHLPDSPQFYDKLAKEEYRKGLIGEVIKMIEKHEKNYASTVNNILETRDDVREEKEKLVNEGFHEGNASLMALGKFYNEQELASFKLNAEKPLLFCGEIQTE